MPERATVALHSVTLMALAAAGAGIGAANVFESGVQTKVLGTKETRGDV